MTRMVMLLAKQQWGSGRRWEGYIVMTPEEAEQLEKVLRLARTGKLGTERRAAIATRSRSEAAPVTKTTFVVKGYEPEEQA